MHDDKVSDARLWSWVDRDAAELRDYLARHPGEAERVRRLQGDLSAVRALHPVPAPAVPASIGPYRVTRRLGAGGMGVVYAAIQPSPEREVAIKVMREGTLDDAGARARFAREAAILGRLQHPAIAAIHVAGSTAEGVPYLVMELVDGDPITTWAARARPDLPRVLGLMAAVCEGVAAAHASGVAHRDLKPGNVLVDRNDRPKIVDFGLGRFLAGEGHVTLTQGFSGTLGYVPPERLAGEPFDRDPSAVGAASERDVRADVYALGVLLFELLTGRLPHPVTAMPLADVVEAVCHRDAPRLTDLVPALAGPIADVCARALERDPRARYADAKALAADLHACARGAPVAPCIGARRQTARMRSVPLLAVPLALAVAWTWWPWREASGSAPTSAILDRSAPFWGVRWDGDRPLALVADGWVRLTSIEGVPVASVVAFCQTTYAGLWRKRFAEDLPLVMRGLGHELTPRVELGIADLDGRNPRLLENVAMSEAARAAVRTSGTHLQAGGERAERLLRSFDPRAPGERAVPWLRVRQAPSGLEVVLEQDGPWLQWVAIDDLVVSDLVAVCQAAFGERWFKRIREDLVQVLALLDRAPGQLVRMSVRAGGEERVVDVRMRST